MAGSDSHSTLLRLTPSVQFYDWGSRGSHSSVARLSALNSGSPIAPDSDRPYAEFWMGTHPSAPTFLVHGKSIVTLKDWLQDNPNVLGPTVLANWGSQLPFLFKVLSVAKALSIQAHPDKELAKALHKLQPHIYKDDNHKPEMALAVTEFRALCGFVSLEELKDVLRDVPEIVELVGWTQANQVLNINHQDGEEKLKSVLQSLFTQLMSAAEEMTFQAISKLKARLQLESQERCLTEKEQLVLVLEKQYPGDIGVMSSLFLNYMKLNPGEALYLGANELHAYLSGDCIECMAASDNVIRAGLTPKYRDTQTLCAMLTYKQGHPDILKGFPVSPSITRYLPPFDEFEVDCCSLPHDASTVFPAIPGPSIFLVLAGEGVLTTKTSIDEVGGGDVLFAPAGTEITVTTSSQLKLYRAGVNSRFLQIL